MTSALFSPFRLAGLELANRIVVSPMCQYSADDGCANDWHLMHLGMLAHSGAALVIVEATHVERHGRITHGCLGLYSDDNEAALARVVAQARRMGTAKFGIQIAHSGRKGSAQRPWEGGGRAEAGGRPVADDCSFADSVRRGLAHAARSDRSRHGARARRPSSLLPSARCVSVLTRSSCIWRTAISRTGSCRRFQTSAATNMAARSRIGCAFRFRSRARCVPWCRKRFLSVRVSPGAIGAKVALRPMTRWRSSRALKAEGNRLHLYLVWRRRRRHPQSHRAGLQRSDRRAR